MNYPNRSRTANACVFVFAVVGAVWLVAWLLILVGLFGFVIVGTVYTFCFELVPLMLTMPWWGWIVFVLVAPVVALLIAEAA